MEIRSERLLLRPVTEDDLEAFHKLQSNYEVTKWTKQGPSKSLQHSEQMLDDLLVLVNMMASYNHTAQPVIIHAITLPPSKTLIGLIGTFRPREIGFSLHPDFWGKGYATEAVRAFCRWYLGTYRGHVLFAKVDRGNERSVACLRRCGFSPAREVELVGDEAYAKDRERETWLLRAS
ncbi:hypothetical protein PRZ48_006919 [Zasmidium cellare]|uniref:N-acetyltransferase domain-containing protein n=1 Tax=Zasmidium cellare TaxID=395010 RepID=A0ABR0EJ87_ZASCE|nr:hypothetical protein PRZ48_006919 [Zasmidium cellare]